MGGISSDDMQVIQRQMAIKILEEEIREKVLKAGPGGCKVSSDPLFYTKH